MGAPDNLTLSNENLVVVSGPGARILDLPISKDALRAALLTTATQIEL